MSSRGSLEGRSKSIPKLRFPGFAGEWSVAPLRQLFKKGNHRNKDGKVKNVITNSAEYGLVPQTAFFDKSIAVEENTGNYYIIQKGDFVYNPRKSKSAPFGPFNRYDGEEVGIVSPLYICLIPESNVITNYLAWFFRSTTWHRYVYDNGSQGARHDRVNMTDDLLFGIPVWLPQKDEQIRIGTFLTLIDSRIAAQRKLVTLLKKQKRGLSNALFSGKLRMVNDLKWKVYRLGDIVRRVTRKNGSASDVPLTISAQHGLIDQREFFSKSVASADMSGYNLLKQGEFAYNRSSSGDCPFGSIKRLERYAQGAVSTLYICFEAIGDSDDSEFLKWYFDSFAWHREVGMICAEGARNHGLLNVPTEGFFDTKHLLPSDKEERKKMAMFMALEAARCEHAECELARLTELKAGFLQQMFA